MSTTPTQIHSFSSTILGDDGEGVILRAPETFYQRGTSENFLKLKVMKRGGGGMEGGNYIFTTIFSNS